jgi:hypothetical protein
VVVNRLVLEPGWRSLDAGEPLIASEWRDSPHFLYHAAGRIQIVTSEGDEFEAGPGDVVSLSPGCEAHVVGDDPVLIVDFYGAMVRRTQGP